MDLILLHGALGSQQDLEALTASLDSRFQVHTFNFHGHGGTAPVELFTMELFVQNLLWHLDSNHISQAALFGYSMGGYVALNFAHQFPERVSKIMTLGTKLIWTPEIAAQEVKQLDPEKIEEKVPKFAAALAGQHGDANWKSVVTYTAAMMSELGDHPPLSEQQFREIQIPVQLVRASEDALATQAETDTVAAWIPGAQTSVVADAKHPLHTVDTAVLAKQISTWF
jgi:pimeloyl-ACP methyl ester carboxylesterase